MNKKIQKVMAQAFEIPEDQININSSLDTLENWDSIHHLRMIVFLEREFDIVIPDEKVGNMINYKLINSVINECINK